MQYVFIIHIYISHHALFTFYQKLLTNFDFYFLIFDLKNVNTYKYIVCTYTRIFRNYYTYGLFLILNYFIFP